MVSCLKITPFMEGHWVGWSSPCTRLYQKRTCRIPLNCTSEVRHFYLYFIVVFSSPAVIGVNMEDSFITKDVFYDCIPLHGNTVFSSFSISPDLPQDLSIDPDRSCIGGVYTGNFYGSQKYLIEGRNYLGQTSSWFTLYFSRHYIIS